MNRRILESYSARRRGRPTIRSKEIENEICHRIARGESLRHICLDPKMPCRDTFFRWLRRDRLYEQILREALSRITTLNIPRARTRIGRKKEGNPPSTKDENKTIMTIPHLR